MSDPSKVLGILQVARERCARDWCSTNLDVEANGDYCASLAMTGIRDEFAEWDEDMFAAHDAFAVAAGIDTSADQRPDVPESIFRWNDMQPNVRPVLAAFDRAIATLQEAMGGPTPDADAALEVMAACDTAGAVVARHVLAEHPELARDEVESLCASELFYAAQDTARACGLGIALERS